VKESMAGTIRIEILPWIGKGVGAALPDGVVGGPGDDSALRREPFCEARTWTPRFIGVWLCLSRNVGDNAGEGGGSE
jgi:hypothetical protein